MDIKVELGFNSDAGSGPFFKIGDSLRGVIGGPYVIGGEGILVDISEQLKSFSITRGKSRELNKFEAGQLNLSFNNNNRWFDPNFEPSPYFGQIVPRREIRISVDGVYQFVGVVEDWSLSYDPSGISTASCVAIDSFAYLAGQTIVDYSPGIELSGARINSVLDEIAWPADLRDLDEGRQLLESQILITPTNVVEYLSTVERSEPGALFIAKDGKVKFVDRGGGYVSSETTFSDDGSGVAYQNISVVYGSELLYNKIVLSNDFEEVLAEDLDSQDDYGVRELIQNTFIEGTEALESTANFLLGKYKDPEFRFEKVTVNLQALSELEQAELLALELGDIVQVGFTPSNIPPQTIRAGRIISIEHQADPSRYEISFGFESLDGSPFIIGSASLGIIGEGTIGF